MIGVIREFIIEIEADQHAAGEANGQPENIDEGKSFVLHQVAPGDFYIILQHNNPVSVFGVQFYAHD